MARIQIRKIEPESLIAPSMVWFEATGLDGFDVAEEADRPHDPSFNQVTFIWTVEGGTLSRYTAPHIPSDWNSATRAYGKKVAFFFTDDDTTYTVKLWAIDASGHIGEASTTVTTGAAREIYPGAQTICLDPSGRFDKKPDGALEVTTLQEAQVALKRGPERYRILFARGQTFDDVLIDARRLNLDYVGSFGDPSAERPILNSVNYAANMFEFSRQSSRPHLTLSDLDLRGDWDASTETGRAANTPFDFFSEILSHFSIWNCRFSGIGTVQADVNEDTAWVGGFGNCTFTNWSGYGVYVPPAPKARLAFVGCDVAQHPDALNHYAGTGRNGLMISQGPVRVPECSNVYFGASSFMGRGGWHGANDQNCLRLNSAAIAGHSYIVERCTLEGGFGVFHMSGSNGNRIETPGNYLMDKVLCLAGGGKTTHFGTVHFGGTTLRNVVMAQLDVPSATQHGYPQSLPMVPHNEDRGNMTAPVAVYNCSVMNLRTPEHDDGDRMRMTAEAVFLDFTEENNIIHAPTLGQYPQDTHAPVTATTPLKGFTPRYKGVRPNFAFEQGELEISVGDGAAFSLPYPEGTDQGYWQALPDSDSQHSMLMHRQVHLAEFGAFEVAYDTAAIRVTNRSGETWDAGWAWVLRLDRKSQIPPVDTTYGNPTDREMPLPIPDAGSSARLSGTPTGRHAYDDFLGRVRPGPSETGLDHTGAPRPTTGGTAGAIHV